MNETKIDEKGVIVACPACGQANRIPFERLGEEGRCGRCQSALPRPASPLDIPDETIFDRLIGTSSLPVVVDFWAPWCGPCRMVAPELEKVAAAGKGRIVVAKVNTEALQGLARRYQVQSIPMMSVFVGGREAARTTGARPAAAIEAFIRETIGS